MVDVVIDDSLGAVVRGCRGAAGADGLLVLFTATVPDASVFGDVGCAGAMDAVFSCFRSAVSGASDGALVAASWAEEIASGFAAVDGALGSSAASLG